MTPKEQQLLVKYLKNLEELLSSRCCDDHDPKTLADWSSEEIKELVHSFHQFNGDPEEFDPDHEYSAKSPTLQDSSILYTLRRKLESEMTSAGICIIE